jgi:hypothetical protein
MEKMLVAKFKTPFFVVYFTMFRVILVGRVTNE